MKELSNPTEIPSGKSVLMIKAEQCGACQEAKPMFESLESKYPSFQFTRLEFTEKVLPFYESVIPKEIVREQKEIDGVMKTVVRKERKISFPNFFFFDSAMKSDENPYGFLGNISGYNEEGLTHVLESLTKDA